MFKICPHQIYQAFEFPLPIEFNLERIPGAEPPVKPVTPARAYGTAASRSRSASPANHHERVAGNRGDPPNTADIQVAMCEPHQLCYTNKVPEPGSIALKKVIKALTGKQTLIHQLNTIEQNNSGTLQECDGCGKILIRDNCVMFGELRCYCENFTRNTSPKLTAN